MRGVCRHPLFPAMFVWLAASVFGLVPPFSRDALNDHLMLPLLWGEHGLFWRNARLAFTAYPPLADIPYLLFAGHAWDWAASLWHAAGALLTLLLLDRAMRRLDLDASGRMWGALVWISMPTVFSLCGWAYDDLWLCATAAGMVLLLSRITLASRDAWMLGILAGLGMLIKYNGIPLALAAGLGLLWRCHASGRTAIAYGLRMAVAAICVAAWWYAWNALALGNPVFPLGEAHSSLSWLAYRTHAYGESLWWAQLAPLRAFFRGEINNPRLFDGMLSPVLLTALPALWAWRHDRRIMALLVAAGCYLAVALSTGVRARYMLPASVFLLPAAMAYLQRLRPSRRRGFLAVSLLIVIYPVAIYLTQLAPWQFWLHGRDAFLRVHVPDYALQRRAATRLPKNAKIYLLWTGGRAYYLERSYRVDFGEEGKSLRQSIAQGTSRPQSYLLMQRNLAERTLGNDMPDKWRAFLAHTCLLARQGEFELRRLTSCR